jgi:hypothetical protein
METMIAHDAISSGCSGGRVPHGPVTKPVTRMATRDQHRAGHVLDLVRRIVAARTTEQGTVLPGELRKLRKQAAWQGNTACPDLA